MTRARAQIRHEVEAGALPDGAMILWNGHAHLVRRDRLLPFALAGYGPGLARPVGAVTALTPAPTLTVLSA